MVGIRVERDGPVTTLRLDRPDHALVRDLYAALGTLHADPSQQVVVLTGTRPAFCSWTGPAMQRTVAGLVGALRRIPQPVIAMVGGSAADGGLSLVCAADLRVAEPAATFGAGPRPDFHAALLPHIVGPERAAEMLRTGRVVGAAEAERIGLVDRVVPAGEGLPTAHALARAIATTAPVSARMTKSLLDLSPDGATLDQVLAFQHGTLTLSAGRS